ncbi:hypothetical protein TSOC_006543, partial [Tetrabaena socialis]
TQVYEYFSSLERERVKYMMPVDLLRAIVPTYPPSESHTDRAGSLDGERATGRPQPFWSKAQTSFFKQAGPRSRAYLRASGSLPP